MTNTVPLERKRPPELDTAVQSLSTLRNSVLSGRDGDGNRTILADVQYAVRATAEASLRRVASPESNLAFQPKVLLSLLVYCYVTGTYSSVDIEDMMRRDVTFRRLCQEEFPSARLLGRFRRENRIAVRDGVYTVLLRQARRRHPPDGMGDSPHLSSVLSDDADGRVLKAMFIDSMQDDPD